MTSPSDKPSSTAGAPKGGRSGEPSAKEPSSRGQNSESARVTSPGKAKPNKTPPTAGIAGKLRSGAAGLGKKAATAAKNKVENATASGKRGPASASQQDARNRTGSKVKDEAKQGLKDLASGAAKGALQGGLAGAAKGAATTLTTSKSARNTVLRVVAVLAVLSLIPAVTFGLMVGSSIMSMFSANATGNAGSAAENDGVQAESVTAAYGMSETENVPFELLTWIQQHEPDKAEDVGALSAEIERLIPNQDDRSLRNGSIINSDGQMQLGDSPSHQAAQERTENGYVAALTSDAFGLDEATARTAFETARNWALGISQTCEDPNSDGNGGGSIAVVGDAKENAEIVYSVLSSWGMSDNGIAGILGNWSVESGIDPTAVFGIYSEQYEIGPLKQKAWDNNFEGLYAGIQHGGIGLGQWIDGRNQNLLSYADAHGVDWYTVETQLAFMAEAEGSDSEIFTGMITATYDTPTEAAQYFHDAWERSANELVPERLSAAEAWIPVLETFEIDKGAVDAVDSIMDTEIEAGDGEGSNGGGNGSTPANSCSDDGTEGGAGAEVSGWPMDPADAYGISSWYGPRDSPCAGCSDFHLGLDIAGPEGAPLYAVADAKVASVGFESCGGNFVLLEHGDGKTGSRYIHMSSTDVTEGQAVSEGDRIGAVGNTGSCTTGSHLHFEVFVDGERVDPVTAYGGREAVLAYYGSNGV
ncbi:MAG: phage tail tip lysozyme [Microbacteriaceae bacterium]